MIISAKLSSSFQKHEVTVSTNGQEKTLIIQPRPNGYGSSINGGELLNLALATCYCNDLYREAAKRNIAIDHIDVTCESKFGAEGEPGSNFNYHVSIQSKASPREIQQLIEETDRVAEVHNTLRKGVTVTLQQ